MTALTAIDRRRQLIGEQSALNGVDYVEVVVPSAGLPAGQLRVSFVNPVLTLPTAGQIVVTGGDRIPTIAVTAVAPTDDPDTILVTLAGGGDLSTYTLRLVSSNTDPRPPNWVDPILAGSCFTFGLDCMSGLACDDEPECPPAAVVEPTLDYLARDWESLRAVLFDRLAVLQPGWTDRNPADLRVALIELLAELGDRASYRQDAIATEAYLGTARRRLSVRRHARLVDYVMSDGTNARSWVQLSVPDDVLLTSGVGPAVMPTGSRLLTGNLDAPCLVPVGSEAETDARRAGALEFQTMHDLTVVSGALSTMPFYTWSGARPVLATGATAATLAGHLSDLAAGQVLILMENRDPVGPAKAVADADPARRIAIRLTSVVSDAGGGPLVDALTGEEITEITWAGGDALPWPLTIEGEIDTVAGGTELFADGALALGNVVLVDHGQQQPPAQFGPVPDGGAFTYRFPKGPLSQVARLRMITTLPGGSGTEERYVTFDPADSATSALMAVPDAVLPAVRLQDGAGDWTLQSDLISSGSARDVVIEVDDAGVGTLRFGRADDGLPTNGQPPVPGSVLQAGYRTGNGVAGNVGAGAIRTVLDDGSIVAALRAVLAEQGSSCRVWNPVPAIGGTEPETIEQVRQRAPFAFRRQERCVTADDYAARAAMFSRPGSPRIQRAVATIRWTGSWYVVVVAVDPVGTETVDADFLNLVRDYLDGFRMAGHDLQVVTADYAALEVGLAVHVDAGYRRDLVRADVLSTMSAGRRPDGTLGLFNPDRLTFGSTVYLGPIVAAAQSIPGVEYVEATRFSRYRQPGTSGLVSGRIDVGRHEIARLDNDPNRPERGRFYLDALVGGR